MTKIKTKKILFGTQMGFDRQMAALKSKGWEVVFSDKLPRGNTGKFIYMAELRKEINGSPTQTSDFQGNL